MKPKAQTERRHVCVHLTKRIRTQFNTNHNIVKKTCAISRIKMSESRLICMTCRFEQKFQWIYERNSRFWKCRN